MIALFDNSLSMQWEKLDRNFQALEGLLHSLKPADKFNLLLFNSDVSPFTPAPGPATPDQIEKALAHGPFQPVARRHGSREGFRRGSQAIRGRIPIWFC